MGRNGGLNRIKKKLMVESIFLAIWYFIKWIIGICLFFGFLIVLINIDTNPKFASLGLKYFGYPMLCIIAILLLYLIVVGLVEMIKSTYSKKLKNLELEEKNFIVEYSVTYNVIRDIKFKDKTLIDIHNTHSREYEQNGRIRIKKTKNK